LPPGRPVDEFGASLCGPGRVGVEGVTTGLPEGLDGVLDGPTCERVAEPLPFNCSEGDAGPVAPGDPPLPQHDEVIPTPDVLAFERTNILW
jgi:hypothetical protein